MSDCKLNPQIIFRIFYNIHRKNLAIHQIVFNLPNEIKLDFKPKK